MRLEELIQLLRPWELRGPLDGPVSGLACDSRKVGAGDVFFAVPGTLVDGHDYLPDAVRRGARAVVVEHRPDALPGHVTCLRLPQGSMRRSLARAAARFHGDPQDKLCLVGITGTNGKTTTSFLVRNILERSGLSTGLIGTIEVGFKGHHAAASATTPDPLELHRTLAQMVAEGVQAAVMEVSSHALDQERTAGLEFAACGFTNLTQDHLDYHGTMVAYLRAKRRLFDDLPPSAVAALNADDGAWEAIRIHTEARTVRYGLHRDGRTGVWADQVELHPVGTRFRLALADGPHDVSLPLIGHHNVSNALCAAAIAQGLGIAPADIVGGLEQTERVAGRLDRVPGPAGAPHVYVDYAHTDDALANILRALRPLTDGRLVCVFGAGGDRDRSKRPRMGRVVEELADRAVVTSDNPRTEEPQSIVNDILGGFTDPDRVPVVLDRRKAIAWALAQAESGDLVVIAGKGHEPYQIVGEEVRPFDDRAVAGEVLQALYGAQAA